jgi:hypothetical protein
MSPRVISHMHNKVTKTFHINYHVKVIALECAKDFSHELLCENETL